MRSSRLAGGLAVLAALAVLLVLAPAALAKDVPASNPSAAETAQSLIGTPYKASGDKASGANVGGFTRLVYRRVGIWLPRRVAKQVRRGTAISRGQLATGDLVFNVARSRVGVYVGNGAVVVMSRSRKAAVKRSMSRWGAGLSFRRYDAATGYNAARLAKLYRGVPYVWGGASPEGFDAPGLTMYVYAQLGVTLGRAATQQQAASTPTPISKLQRGDLVFFGDAEYSYHVGIYVGNGRMVHAPYTGAEVGVDDISDAWIGGRLLPVR